MTPVPPLPVSPDDLVIFFPPGVASRDDATCLLKARGQGVIRLILRKGAEMLAIAERTFPIMTQAKDRPVVVRISARNDSIWCQVGSRPATAAPELAAALRHDEIEASTGIVVERIAAIPGGLRLLPRGFAAGSDQAGAVDHVSVAGGITGWIADLARAEPHIVELRCGLALIATTRADRTRRTTAPLADKAPLGRFSIPWAEVDRDALNRCPPHAAVIALIPTLNARLDDAYRPLSARTALSLMGPELRLEPLPLAPGSDPESRCIAPASRGETTAIILSYNYAHYLPQRIATVISPDINLILLDDASTDESLTVARHTAPDIRIVTYEQNSGAVLPQWRRAAMLAETEYLLIAEADDVADPALIPTLAALLDANPDMAFAFADSAQIDVHSAVTLPDHKAYYAALGDRALEREQIMPADTFLLRFLLPRNLIVNVSAVLWRTVALRAAFARLGDEIDHYRATGDWRVYIEVCRAGGTIGYTPRVLNHFRRHEGSVIARQTRATHLAEVEKIHALLLSLIGNDPTTAERLAHHRATLHRLWSMDAADEAP